MRKKTKRIFFALFDILLAAIGVFSTGFYMNSDKSRSVDEKSV